MITLLAFTLVVICLISVSPILANAQYVSHVEISLTSQVYHYGEKLDYTIIVSDVTGHDARIYITDPAGKRTPLVTMPISYEETRVVAPIGFDSIIWNEGKYSLELEYSNASHKIDFTIIDDGSVGIPYWINDLAKLWLTSQILDKEFVKGIEYLIEHKILDAPESDNALYIPKWFKFTTAWWSTGAITDTTYAHAIQFLINEKFMIIPFDQELSDSTTERSL